jgi:hypothetical protein
MMRYLVLGLASYFASRTQSKTLKWSLIAGLALVVYQDVKANGGKLAGNPSGWGVSMDYKGMVDAVIPGLGNHNANLIATALGSLFARYT